MVSYHGREITKVRAACAGFVLLLLSIGVYGCVPGPYIYHEPSAAGGVLVHSVCSRFAPRDTIQFPIGGIKVQLGGQNLGLTINIYVPEGKTAQFLSDEIGLYEDKPENTKTFTITRSVYYDGQPAGYVTVKPTDILIGRTKPLVKYGFAADRLFEMSVQFDKKERDHFYVRLPALRVGGQLYEFPVIEFNKKTGVGIMPINC